jgi:flagellar hook protein FlgE
MRNHQVRMDVVANNIANVNTVGFKAKRATFKEAFSQSVRSATRPTAERGGLNPLQIGLGMQVASIDTKYTQGFMETTGVATDLAIEGDALFVVRNGTRNIYTRAGNFNTDAEGRLVSAINGAIVQGFLVDPLTGTIPVNGPRGDLIIPHHPGEPPRAGSADHGR